MDAGPPRHDGLEAVLMMRCLLLFLLVIGLSLPAVAMTGHCAVAATGPAATSHHAGHHKAPAKAAAKNDCIGCVTPPVDGRPRFRAPHPDLAVHSMTNEAFRAIGTLEPATPPPRA